MSYSEKKAELGLIYGILDSPSWYGTLFYGVQVNNNCLILLDLN